VPIIYKRHFLSNIIPPTDGGGLDLSLESLIKIWKKVKPERRSMYICLLF